MNRFAISSGGRWYRNSWRCSRSLIVGSIIALSALASAPELAAQGNREFSAADSMIYAAITHIDQGNLDEARAILNEGAKRFPANSMFPYEMAYIAYFENNYSEAREILLKLVDAPDANDRTYQLLGNAHDMLGDTKAAIAIYDKGIARFPGSGPLHLERGIMSAKAGDIAEAVGYWERGVDADPQFPSNYFHLARTYMQSVNPGWGVLYGEIFLNLEPRGQRTDYIREMLFATWGEAIAFGPAKPGTNGADSETSGSVSLFKQMSMTIDPETRSALFPFEMMYEKAVLMGALPVMFNASDTLTLEQLHKLRVGFIETWFADTATSGFFAIELFHRMRTLKDLGLLEAYDYMTFRAKPNYPEFAVWMEKNSEKIDQYAEWMAANPIAENPSAAFARARLKGIPLPKVPDSD